nr:hypothetical protein [Clostridia bacterium]
MKAKKIVLALAAVLAFCSFAACTDTDQKIIFNDYWEEDSLSGSSSINETLEYKVTYEKSGGADAIGYTLTYGEGKYTTTLKSHTHEGQQAYSYTTSLTMPVTYQYGTDEAVSLTDTVTTEVVFLRSKDSLRPISSTKKTVSHTPLNSAGTTSKSCYATYDFSVVTTYPAEGKATSTVTYNRENDEPTTATSTFSPSNKKLSYLDNEQLLLALRAISSSTSSGSVKIYNPFIEAKQTIKFSFSEETGSEFTYLLNGENKKENITYRPVSITIDDRNPGSTQTAWIAKTTNPQKNTQRNVMVKLIVPLSYSLGNLVYDLVSVSR